MIKKIFDWYFSVNLLKRILTGLILGFVVGVSLTYFPDLAEKFINTFQIFGDIFIRLLKMIVVPIIFFSLITGAASISPDKLGRIGIKTLLFYMSTTLFAVILGLLLANVFKPGMNLNIIGNENIAEKINQSETSTTAEILLNIIPTNPIESLAKGDVLPIIFFAILVGIVLAILRESENKNIVKQANTILDFCSGWAEIIYKLVSGIMQYAPIGVFVLIAIVFAQNGSKVIGPLLFLTLLVYIGFIVQLIVCYGGLLTLNGLNLIKFLKLANEAMITAFVTRSSSATLPISLKVSNEKLGVPSSLSSFALPIGATVNMHGTAIQIVICAVFIGFATNQPLDFNQQITIMLTATLASIGAAGVPGAGALMLIMALESVGLNLDAGSSVAICYAMILGIDALLDMGQTSMNVTGDIVGAVLVSKSEKSLDLNAWN